MTMGEIHFESYLELPFRLSLDVSETIGFNYVNKIPFDDQLPEYLFHRINLT